VGKLLVFIEFSYNRYWMAIPENIPETYNIHKIVYQLLKDLCRSDNPLTEGDVRRIIEKGNLERD
jgi:hypothetical protein